MRPQAFTDDGYCSCGHVKYPNRHLCPHCDTGVSCPPGCPRCEQRDCLCRVCWTTFATPERALQHERDCRLAESERENKNR